MLVATDIGFSVTSRLRGQPLAVEQRGTYYLKFSAKLTGHTTH